MKSDKDKNEIQKVADNIISSVNYLPNTGILDSIKEITNLLDFSNLGLDFTELTKNVKEVLKEYDLQEKQLEKIPLYWELKSELDTYKLERDNALKELNEIRKSFNTIYNKVNNIQSEIITPKKAINKNYSLICEYSSTKIMRVLYPLFDKLFECTKESVINFLSENITTSLTVKKDYTLNDVVRFLVFLKDEGHIQSPQLGNVIDKTKSIIWNGKPITATQIKKTKDTFKQSCISQRIENVLNIIE